MTFVCQKVDFSLQKSRFLLLVTRLLVEIRFRLLALLVFFGGKAKLDDEEQLLFWDRVRNWEDLDASPPPPTVRISAGNVLPAHG